MKKVIFPLIITLLFSMPVFAGTQADALKFFDSYVNAANNYSNNLLDYYSPNAKIIRVVVRKDGTKGTATFAMKDYAYQMKIGAATAKVRKYKNYYTKRVATKTSNGYKISCLRQPIGETYKLNAYFVVSDASGKWKIIEEMMETKVQAFDKYTK
ncbi:hypothetical protein IJS77_03170 [bacterium]|nr:hypothetical protein [bacterium]